MKKPLLLPRDPHTKRYRRQPISMVEIGWIAGILEGEAWFGPSVGSTERGDVCPTIQVKTTDEDIVRRLGKLLRGRVYLACPTGRNGKHLKLKNPSKALWAVSIYGAKAAGIMMTILPLMGNRRAETIRRILSAWKKRG